jgi:hypothetical protein
VVQQVQAAGGSFKALQKHLHKQTLQVQKQLASAGGEATTAAAAVGDAGAAFLLLCSDLQLEAAKAGKAAAVVSGLLASAGADEAGGRTAVLNPVLQPLTVAEGSADGCKTLGARQVMSHPVAWADGADLDD